MADESAEKTEQPTPKKLQDAAKKGQIARSKDMGTAFVLIGSAAAILVFGKMFTLLSAIASRARRRITLHQAVALLLLMIPTMNYPTKEILMATNVRVTDPTTEELCRRYRS